MKKYIIKNADGSKQNVMKAVHTSFKEAGKAVMEYVDTYNVDLTVDDDNYLTPFDFIIEEGEYKEVNEVITDFESARKALGLKPNDCLSVINHSINKCPINLKKAEQLIHNISQQNLDVLITLNKLFTIAQAWNKEDEFVPDFSDISQIKYYPAFRYDGGIKKFTLCNAMKTMKCDAMCLNQICFKTKERADQFGEQFIDLFNKVFL